MPFVDPHGRLFGRLNVLDAAALVFVIVLIPLAYGSYLLFRPAAPRIDSVTRAEVTREERRIAGGALLSAKLKVKGSGFNPMLRAEIGGQPVMGFVFENPNSADLLVGPIAAGTHDLVLFDGVQEVARATGAVTITAPATASVRLAGRLLSLDAAVARALQVDTTFIALGPVEPARARVGDGTRTIELPVEGRVEREAVVQLACDPVAAGSEPASDPCSVGGQSLISERPVIVTVSSTHGALPLIVSDVLPAADPQRATARVRFSGGDELAALRVGDRDALLDSRAAVITAITARNRTSATVTLQLGVDSSREGWRYRGQLALPGAQFTLTTRNYVAAGHVQELSLGAAPGTQTR